jgi:hypothetical protein
MKYARKICIPGLLFATLAIMALTASAQSTQIAPDASGVGPLEVTSSEYKLPPTLDLDVSGMATELWARVYRPVTLDNPPYPLLVFLHGNHGTCGVLLPSPPFPPNIRNDNRTQYTFYGTCPTELGYVVTPNHLGYSYIAERLASWGYIVVSINANRGVTAAPGTTDDLGVNLVRGRLVLRHLQRLSEWNTNGGTPDSLGVELQGTLDFGNVGLLGHSRGGEGVRAAYNQYRDPGSPWPAWIPNPITFQGIFEIGPVDGQSNRVLNADGTTWNVLLPMCDGDVSNLQGIKPLGRMMVSPDFPATQKSSFTVWGTNHNFYNTEWQISDSDGCSGPGNPALFGQFIPGSEKQRQVSQAAVMAFFRGNVGAHANPSFNQNFNPQYMLPPVVTSATRVDRGFTDSPGPDVTLVAEDFDRPTGTSSYGVPNNASNITISHGSIPNDSDPDPYGRPGVQRAAAISWSSSSGVFQTNWTNSGDGRDIINYRTLDVRLARQCNTPSCQNPNPLNPAGPTNFSVQLVLGDDSVSDPVQIKDYTSLVGPVGGGFTGNPLHPILQTARISLQDFTNADLTNVRGVRFSFNGTATGAIYVANIRLSLLSGSGTSVAAFAAGSSRENDVPEDVSISANPVINTDGNTLTVRTVNNSMAVGNQPAVEIVVTSNAEFPVKDELAVLRIGDKNFALSRYPDTGETNSLIFTLTSEEFAQVSSGAPVFVQYGFGDNSRVQWNFGTLDKGAVNR